MERLKETEKHDSQRGEFAYELYNQMIDNEDIVVVTADLGFGLFDKIKRDFPDRFYNVGASEQAAMGVAVGMALEGKIPVIYSITPFLLYRSFETIRNYINQEQTPVILIGGGRNDDYAHDGPSHHAFEDRQIMEIFDRIDSYWPDDKEEIPLLLEKVLTGRRPAYINLRR